jgi:hypothetical protein
MEPVSGLRQQNAWTKHSQIDRMFQRRIQSGSPRLRTVTDMEIPETSDAFLTAASERGFM